MTRRGWRNFLAAPIPRAEASIEVDGRRIALRADASGYLDVRVKKPGLDVGWGEVTITAENSTEQVAAPVMVVSADETFGLVSDIDDTVISTFLPRLFIAAWNTLVITEQAREAVPGMARMYQKLLADHPGAPVIYVSTGAWNTYPFLARFLGRHGFPRGPMLLTDWGPTNTGWFRSGPDHKRVALRELARDFPGIKWVLIGDDGQHDPHLYAEFAELQPDHVRAIAIRELTLAEQVLAHGTPMVFEDDEGLQWTPDMAPEVRGADGDVLAPLLQGVLNEASVTQD
ncbi:MAG TPA: phosphatase domain-containing protein [Propionibacteriaceae bacterium]|nr:phosphatase domain-containing protein [Propionibacteriaceae bacterium]